MFKRIIFFITLLNSLSIATEISTNIVSYTTYANGAVNVYINYYQDADKDTRDKSQDWIAVYKKGTTNDWKNVINWAWVNNLLGNHPGDNYGHIFRDTHIVEAGEYEVRFFKNNSFIVDKSLSFTIKKIPSFLNKIYKAGPNTIHTNGFDGHTFTPAPKDWIGIYKENDDNTWQNVIQWGWLKDLKKYHYLNELILDKNLYQEGVKYKARYFLNNSFHTYKETEPFYMGELPDDEKDVLDVFTIKRDDGSYLIKGSVLVQYVTSSKDWIGLFKKNVEFTEKSNLIAWSYAGAENGLNGLEILKPELFENGGEYKAIFFKNDSYKKFGKVFTFTQKD